MNLTRTIVRRAFVVGGVAAALVGGALSVSAAAGYVAANDPTPAATTGPLADTLAREQARTLELSTQLVQLQDRLAELEASLANAEANADADAEAAAALREQLATAKAKMEALRKQLAAQQAAARREAARTTAAAGDHDDDDDDHEGEGDDD